MIDVGVDFCGVGAFTQSLKRLKIKFKTILLLQFWLP